MLVRLYFKSVLTAFFLILSTVCFAENNLAAINLHWANDYSPPFFADAMLTCREWDGLVFNSGGVTVDAQGWPTSDAAVIVWSGYTHRSGVYKLKFEGQANISFEWASVGTSITNINYNSSINTTTADVNIASACNSFRLKFTGTTGGVKNVQLMRPIAEGSSTAHAFTETFDRKMIDILKQFDVVRYMDFQNTNENPQKSWSDRVLPGSRQNVKQQNLYLNKLKPKGCAWEYVIMLSNETGTSPWINIPHLADDNYVTQLANLFKNGANGYPALDANLNLYIEYSNELWNTGSGFSQTNQLADSAEACVRANINHPINYDLTCTTNDSLTVASKRWTLFPRIVAYRSAQISQLIRNVFGNTEIMTRIKPLLCWQVSKTALNNWGSQELNFIDKYFSSVRADNPTPRQANYFYWGGGSAGYYAPETTATISDVWDSKDFNVATWAPAVQYASALTSAFGLKLVFYEGGPSFGSATGANGYIPIGATSWNTPEMKNEILEHHNAFTSGGGKIFNHYVLYHDYRWKFIGAGDAADSVNTYKMQALAQIRTEMPTLTEGDLLPTAMWGGDFDAVFPASKLNTVSQNRTSFYSLLKTNNEWISYRVRSANQTNYLLSIEYSTAAAGNMQIEFNGNILANLSLSNTANVLTNTAQFPIHTDANELYAIRLKNTGNADIKINKVNVIADTTTSLNNSTSKEFRIRAENNQLLINSFSIKQYSVSIYSTSGNLISQYKNLRNVNSLDISSLRSGLYLAIVAMDNELRVLKFLK